MSSSRQLVSEDQALKDHMAALAFRSLCPLSDAVVGWSCLGMTGAGRVTRYSSRWKK